MLIRKMLRDIKLHFSQFLAIFLMVMIGVGAFTGIEAYMAGMEATANDFYGKNNLQELDIYGTNFIAADLEAVKNLENVQDAERKLTVAANVNNADDVETDKTLSLNFIESNEISQFYVVEGEAFDAGQSGVWLDDFYAEANNLKVGDEVSLTFNGYTLSEKILGLINVPDHVYSVKDESELYPDHTDFGFAYLSSIELRGYIEGTAAAEAGVTVEQLRELGFNYQDHLTFTTIMVDVAATEEAASGSPLATEKTVSEVKDEVEATLLTVSAVIDVRDSASYATYQSEIDEGKTYIGVFSGLFIFIALLSVITTMTRVVKKQRTEIGTLKALGFRDGRIVLHYLGYGFWVALAGALAGLVVGYWTIGQFFISLEMSFFEIPNGHPEMVEMSYLCAVLVVLAVVAVTYLTCRSELKRMSAETLRVGAPNASARSLRRTTAGLFRHLNFSALWNLRDILRNKARTLTGVIGIAGCCTLIVCAFGMLDSLNHFISLQFDYLYNFDYKMSLQSSLNDEGLEQLYQKYGDYTSETLLIETKNAAGEKASNNAFVTDAGDLVRFLDDKEQFIDPPSDEGVYITYKLAEQLDLAVGDQITWRLSGSSEWFESEIVGFNRDPQNQNITMSRGYYESLGLDYQPDALYVKNTDDAAAGRTFSGDSVAIADLSTSGTIAGVELIQDKNSLKDSMENMLSTMKEMIVLIIVVAVGLGTVIIYNTGVLSYTEKQYQFATLKVLGFSDRRIQKIFIQQNNWLTVVAILLGLPLGFWLVDWLFRTAIGETYDFQAYILPLTYIIAALGTLLVSYLTARLLARKIRRIDMVSSLKSNE